MRKTGRQMRRTYGRKYHSDVRVATVECLALMSLADCRENDGSPEKTGSLSTEDVTDHECLQGLTALNISASEVYRNNYRKKGSGSPTQTGVSFSSSESLQGGRLSARGDDAHWTLIRSGDKGLPTRWKPVEMHRSKDMTPRGV